jgi:hypothetical protein
MSGADVLSYGSLPVATKAKKDKPIIKYPHDGLQHMPLSGQGVAIRFNWNSVIITATSASIVYTVISFVLSFSLHYDNWLIAWGLSVAMFFPCGVWLNKKITEETRLEDENPGNAEAKIDDQLQIQWFFFAFFLCLFAGVAGIAVGEVNYHKHMKTFYDYSHMNLAPAVDPSRSSQQYIDAGRFIFTPRSHIKTAAAMGLRIEKTYCAAPIINPDVLPHLRMYDFWAVGTDCCSAQQPQDKFACGEIMNNYAHAGMRLLDSESRELYRMAVQEAEATYGTTYNISAKNPIFVEWVQDPTREMANWYNKGVWMFVAGVLTMVVTVTFTSLGAALVFSEKVLRSYPCKGLGFCKSAAASGLDPEKALNKYDENHDGFVSRTEIEHYLARGNDDDDDDDEDDEEAPKELTL